MLLRCLPAPSSSSRTLSLPAPRPPAPPPRSQPSLSPSDTLCPASASAFSFLHQPALLPLHSPDTLISTPANQLLAARLTALVPSGPCPQPDSPCDSGCHRSQGIPRESAAARGQPSSFPQGPVLVCVWARAHRGALYKRRRVVPEKSDKMSWNGKRAVFSACLSSACYIWEDGTVWLLIFHSGSFQQHPKPLCATHRLQTALS